MKAILGKAMCRLLKRQGWKHVRTRGSHRRFEKTGYHPITVPVHGNQALKTGLQRAIMKAAGLAEEDLGDSRL